MFSCEFPSLYWNRALEVGAVSSRELRFSSGLIDRPRNNPPPELVELYRPLFATSDDEYANNTLPFWGNGLDIGESGTFGPCYLPSENDMVDWGRSIEESNMMRSSVVTDGRMYPDYSQLNQNQDDLRNMCKPGFLIIGAGKAGTSSLYQYLTGHPSVLPAKMKQVQYFKYNQSMSIKWYLSHFPSSKSFLSSGALMTGEAAPGYLPYPDVAWRAQTMMPGSKLMLLVREPISRAWSSYNYNYFIPGLEKLKKDPKHLTKSDEELVEKHLFSFEDMLIAELNSLKECLKSGGAAEMEGLKQSHWSGTHMKYRQDMGLPPLVDIIYACYGTEETRDRQWRKLLEQKPQGLLDLPNVHRWEGMLGRGLYAVQAEWWYAAFPHQDIYVICSEEMKDNPNGVMDDLTDFLGLPNFDYEEVTSMGMYNVRGNKGYNKAVSWNDINKTGRVDEFPLSDAFRLVLDAFLKVHNDRLYKLTGVKCQWQ